MDPELLERLRRGVPLRMTAGGAWWFGDEPVTHPGVDAALRGGLDLSDGGEPIVRLGTQWCYVTIDDAPLRVIAIAGAPPEVPTLVLDDARRLALDPQALVEDPEAGLRTQVPAQGSGRPLAARFTNRALGELQPWLDLDGAVPRLRLGDRGFAIVSAGSR